MHYNTSQVNSNINQKSNDFNSSRSPSYSPKPEMESYNAYKRETELYSPKRDLYSPKKDLYSPTRDLYSPNRELYSPKRDLYLTKMTDTYKTEFNSSETKKKINLPSSDYYFNKENELYNKKTLSESLTDIPRYSPSLLTVETNSYKRQSPVTLVTTTNQVESVTRNMSSSPVNLNVLSSSRYQRSSPVHYLSSATHRISSPMEFSSDLDSYKTSKESTYKTSDDNFRSRRSISPEVGVDRSSNVKVSSNMASSRRDSWDVINKTKHMLSHNSLESLANMTESQLNTDLSYERPKDIDHETERNTQYNKFLNESRHTSALKFEPFEMIERHKFS